MSEPTVNHHVKDRSAIQLTNRAPSRLSATLAKGPQAVKNQYYCGVQALHMLSPYWLASDLEAPLSPR